MQRLHKLSTMGKKAVIEVHHTHELSQLSLRCRLRKVADNLHFVLEGGTAMLTDVMPKEGETGHSKLTLVWVDNHSMCAEAFKDESYMLEMFV